MTNDAFAALTPAQRALLEKQRFIKFSRFIAQNGASAGQFVQPVPRRIYLQGESVAPIVGYLGEINRREIRLFRHRGYGLGDRVGKAGVERWYEAALSGNPGRRVIKINAPGKYLAEHKTYDSERGNPLQLTIDLELQQGKIGGVVFMRPKTGEIVALATSPSFSPEPGPDGLTPMNWSRLATDPLHPLMNRAISSHLPLGSVFKLVVATAALEEGVATPESIFHCGGVYPMKGRPSPRCYTSHGAIDFVNGISMSCDVVFYTLGIRLGVTKINKYAKMMGLGSKTGIDVPGESVGLIPDEAWKKQFAGGSWTDGDTINLSIGQGDVQITPIQVARMVDVFASDGYLVTPHVARGRGRDGRKLPISEETLSAVRLGMRGAVTHGTCRGVAEFPLPVAAKTGTAETGTRTNKKVSHSWFAGFVPYDNPVLVFAVYIEHGGYGAAAALPVAREVLYKALELGYFDGRPEVAAYRAARSSH